MENETSIKNETAQLGISNEYPLFPELTEQGKQEAQDLIIKFQKILKEKAEEIMSSISSDFYTDIINEVESDHWINYRTKLLNGLCNYSNKKTQNSYDYDRIRKSIYENHKEDIVKDLNQDLLAEIEDLKRQLKKAYEQSF